MVINYVWIYTGLGAALVALALFVIALNSMPAKSSAIDANLATCHAFPNRSTERVKETSRLTIFIPKELYPNQNGLLNFQTASGTASAGYISNAGAPGSAYGSNAWCYATYYEFEGDGEVDLTATSSRFGVPDYKVRFLVAPQDP